MVKVVEIGVGYDPFHAQVIADHCADEGIHGEILLYDETRYELGAAARVQNRFVCAAEHEAAVRQITTDLYPDPGPHPAHDSPPLATIRTSLKYRVVGALLAFIFIGPMLYWGLRLLGDAFGL